MSESDLDAILAEIDRATLETKAEIAGLTAATEAARLAAAGLESARELIAGIRASLAEIDVTPAEMDRLPAEEREAIYRGRQVVARQVVRRVVVGAGGEFEVVVRAGIGGEL